MYKWDVLADREMVEQALVLSLLVSGRTTFQNFSLTNESLRFANALKNFGFDFKEVANQLVVEGVGFSYSVPSLLPLEFSKNANVLLLALASKDLEAIYTISATSKETLEERKQLLQEVAKVNIRDCQETSFTFSFLPINYKVRTPKTGRFPYWQRNFNLLSALVSGEEIAFEERLAVRDQWTSMLCHFGVNATYELHVPEFKDEFERRLAKAQGIKMIKTWKTFLSETRVLSPREYFVPSDVTLASAYALATLLSPNANENVFSNVVCSPSRASVFTVLKRMGADLEFTGRHERFGEPFADLVVKPLLTKRLQGCHFSGDSLVCAIEEIPILAVAACFAEKETILHLPPEEVASKKAMLECLAQNLRKTGAEIGVYEDGIVIRGKEEPDSSEFDCMGYPVVGLALTILNALIKQSSEISGIETTNAVFPGACQQIMKICSKES